MHSLITSYLLQNKECILPGIGVLHLVHTPASSDIANNRILPAYEAIIFKREDHSTSPGLVKYISDKKNIEQSMAKDLLVNFCNEWKEKINAGERLHFETIGSLQKNADGIITFEKEKGFHFFQPIAVDSVYHREDTPVVVEEEAVISPDEYKTEEKVVVERSYWGIWALILFAIAAVMLFYHFKDHKPSASNIGNQHKFNIDSVSATYKLRNK